MSHMALFVSWRFKFSKQYFQRVTNCTSHSLESFHECIMYESHFRWWLQTEIWCGHRHSSHFHQDLSYSLWSHPFYGPSEIFCWFLLAVVWFNQCALFWTVDVLLKAVGDTPIMKTKKWAVERGRTVQALGQFIARFLKLEPSEQLVRWLFAFHVLLKRHFITWTHEAFKNKQTYKHVSYLQVTCLLHLLPSLYTSISPLHHHLTKK